MADGSRVLASEAGGACPFGYNLATGDSLELESATGTFDGSGAAGSFLPALAVYLQSGELVGRFPTSEAVAAGASAEVSFGPF